MPIRFLILVVSAALLTGTAKAATTLDGVRAVGTLRCGVVATPEDWNKSDLHGTLTPLSLEMCKAVAVAVLGQKARVAATLYHQELEAERGLAGHEVDLIAGVTPTATAMWRDHIAFSMPYFYDGQGFLVRNDAPVHSIHDLAGLGVCVIEGTDNEQMLLAHTVNSGIAINPMPFQEEGEMDDALAVRHCDAITADLTHLAMIKAAYPKQIGKDRILPDLLTLSPVAMAYRYGDQQWSTISVLVQAEASSVTRANVSEQGNDSDLTVQRLVGIDWGLSRALGLADKAWAAKVIAVVGNYGEIYDRTVGAHGGLKMPRGMNALWTQGGLMRPQPMQ
jgi:general L-amino acid transport system substrate-binding protein